MAKKDPEVIADILAELKNTTELGKHLEHARIWESWPEIAGAELCGHGSPLGVREQTLFIEVESPVWMHKFAFYKWDILQRVTRLIGPDLISEIYIRLQPDILPPPSQDGG